MGATQTSLRSSGTLSTPSHDANNGLKITQMHSKREKRTFTQFHASLPTGWENYFSARRVVSGFGFRVQCGVCGERPPREVEYGYARWRWVEIHTVKEHCGAQAIQHRRIEAKQLQREQAKLARTKRV